MNKNIKNIANIVLPVMTLVIGIFIGMHYLDFKNKVVMYIDNGYTAVSSTNNDVVKSYLENLNSSNGTSIFKSEIEDPPTNYSLPTKNEIHIEELWNVWEVLRNKFYVDSLVVPKDILYGAISGMVDALDDDNTVFLNPDQTKDFEIEVSGELEGIGAEITYRKKNLVILSIIKNSPAFEAGLKTDDIIIKIDDVKTSEYDFFEAIKHIRGQKGTDVTLAIIREDVGAFEITITRDKVHVDSVEWKKVDGYALLQINRFTQDVGKEFKKVANEIIAFDPEGIILDLRDNGGGYMDQAIELIDAFVSDGLIVSRKYKNGEKDVFYATNNTIFEGYPLVVLINSESASASEIVAGVIQDYELGILIGQNSYGKGSVQTTFDFNGATLKMTIAKWFTPNDRNIDKVGLEVDILVEPEKLEDGENIDNDEDLELKRAIEYFKTGK